MTGVGLSVYGLTSFVLDRYWLACVNGASMKPTLNPEWGLYGSGRATSRDWLLIKRVRNHRSELKEDAIVVFVSPEEPKTTAIKRVKALPGHVYQPTRMDMNGTPFKPPARSIPRGHIWVEGDNQASSVDSNNYGPIPMGLVQGKAVCVLYPKFKWL